MQMPENQCPGLQKKKKCLKKLYGMYNVLKHLTEEIALHISHKVTIDFLIGPRSGKCAGCFYLFACFLPMKKL